MKVTKVGTADTGDKTFKGTAHLIANGLLTMAYFKNPYIVACCNTLSMVLDYFQLLTLKRVDINSSFNPGSTTTLCEGHHLRD